MPKGRLNLATWIRTLTEKSAPREYTGEDLRCVAMPLGGIGTGSIALCGDGSLRQWQVVNQVNHIACVPDSFFAVWARQRGMEPVAKLLQSAAFAEDAFDPAPAISDHYVPPTLVRRLRRLPCVEETRFSGEYPIARLVYIDRALPVDVSLEAFSPFKPFDAEASGIPAILFTFRVKNRTKDRVSAALMAGLQNFVGWDGVSLMSGVQNPGYGGNQNILHRTAGCYTLEMVSSRLQDDHPHWGELALAALADDVSALPQWDDVEQMWHDFQPDGAFPTVSGISPSAPWRTWNGSLAAKFELQPQEAREITFVLAWYFPNRLVNWRQPAGIVRDEKSRFWLGNYYNRFGSVAAVVQHVRENFVRMREDARRFVETMYQSCHPYWLLDAVTANIVPARTNICLRTQKGEFFGFEGGCGASTDSMRSVGGCCPLNCTHVWNYVLTLGRLWPELELSMRRTDWLINQHPTGYLPHRTPLPEYLPRLWEMPIGGPPNPALDGLFGAVLKTLLVYQSMGDKSILETLAPKVFLAMDYVMEKHDTDGDGVLKGEQPNTYDIHLYGPNTFIGSLYLAALLAAAKLAEATEDRERAARYRDRADKGSHGYDKLCWNGSYYIQVVDLEQYPEYQYAEGCASDQLLGQWWAHILGLGYVLPKEHVRIALRSIFERNFRDGFEGFVQEPRVFASPNDRGLLVASYEPGKRPKVPLLYSDEVWTGIEYAVAALMLHEGLTTEGLAIVKAARDRYDGYERNPWNEVECGDHYVRPMSSWSLLDLTSGVVYEAREARIRFRPTYQREEFCGFFTAGRSYGLYRQTLRPDRLDAAIEVADGELALQEVVLEVPGQKHVGEVLLDGTPCAAKMSREGDDVRVKLSSRWSLAGGQTLTLRLST